MPRRRRPPRRAARFPSARPQHARSPRARKRRGGLGSARPPPPPLEQLPRPQPPHALRCSQSPGARDEHRSCSCNPGWAAGGHNPADGWAVGGRSRAAGGRSRASRPPPVDHAAGPRRGSGCSRGLPPCGRAPASPPLPPMPAACTGRGQVPRTRAPGAADPPPPPAPEVIHPAKTAPGGRTPPRPPSRPGPRHGAAAAAPSARPPCRRSTWRAEPHPRRGARAPHVALGPGAMARLQRQCSPRRRAVAARRGYWL
mmetsp:Transcript_48669/g.155746  ORF Transcript_48669/g.155746 Transcript_48669/m.155746 type:complete len:256 (-) Transcript_48669:2244-3011(-)